MEIVEVKIKIKRRLNFLRCLLIIFNLHIFFMLCYDYLLITKCYLHLRYHFKIHFLFIPHLFSKFRCHADLNVWISGEGLFLACGLLIKRIEFAVFLVPRGNKVARALIALLSRVCTKIKTRNFIASRSEVDKNGNNQAKARLGCDLCDIVVS